MGRYACVGSRWDRWPSPSTPEISAATQLPRPATLPIPALSFVFARHVGRMAAAVGPRSFLIAGPALAGIGLLLIRPKANGFHAFTDLVPGVTVLAIGLVATITRLMSVMLASVPTERSGLASAINNAVSRLAALISIGSMGVISGGTASAIGFAHVVRGERRTIRRERVVRRAADNQSPCAPTCTQRHLGVVPRSARCATRPGQQPLGGGRTIPSAVIVHPLRRTPP
jgi:uncharacterized membrane protein